MLLLLDLVLDGLTESESEDEEEHEGEDETKVIKMLATCALDSHSGCDLDTFSYWNTVSCGHERAESAIFHEMQRPMHVRLRYSGRAYDMAEHLPPFLELPAGADLRTALEAVQAAVSKKFPLPTSCLVAVNGRHAGTAGSFANCPLSDGDEILLVAPVAGG